MYSRLLSGAGDTEGAALLQSALDKQLKGSAGLAAADKFFENAFNSSGEKNVISALEAAGIDVPDSIKNKNFRGDPDFDGELMTYMSKYSKIINEKILKRGASKVATPSSTSSVTKEEPGDPTFLGGTKISKDDDDGPPVYKPGPKTVRPRSRPSSGSGSDSGSSASTSNTTADKVAENQAQQIAEAESDDIYAQINKGGLMKKKKK